MITLLFLSSLAARAGDRHSANAAAVSPDGATVWTGDDHDKVVRAWDTTTGALRATLPFPDASSIARIDAGANGALLVASAIDSWLVLPDGTVKPLEGAAALDRSGTRLVLVGRSGEVTVHSVPELAEVSKVQLAQGYNFVVGYDLSPDGRYLAVGTSEWKKPTNIEVWDLQTGTAVGTIPKVWEEGADDLEVSPDGSRVVYVPSKIGKDTFPIMYDARTGKKVGEFSSLARAHDLAWSDDGKQLVVAAQDGISRWNADLSVGGHTSYVDGTSYSDGRTYSNQFWVSIASTPDGSVLAGGATGEYDKTTWGVVRDEKLYYVDLQIP